MAKKKVAPNRGKHSASREAEEAVLQLGAVTAARNTAPPPVSDAAKNTGPAPDKNTAPAFAKNTGPDPDKNTAPAFAKNTGPAPDKNTAPAFAKNTGPAPDKNTAPAPDKNTAPAPAKNTASASAKNKAPVPSKNKAYASAKNAVAVPSASSEDEVGAPPHDAALRRFINFLCEKATSMWWKGLLDAFLTWVHGRAGDDTSDASSVSHSDGLESSEQEETVVEDAPSGGSIHEEEGSTHQQQASPHLPEAEARAPAEGSAHQEQRENSKDQKNQSHLEETKNTQQQASPQLREERRFKTYAFIYGKDAGHRNARGCDEAEAEHSLSTGPSIGQELQHGLDQDDAYLYAEDGGDLAENEEACSVPEGPLINQIVEVEDTYRNERRYEEFCEDRMKLSIKRELCTICFFEDFRRFEDASVKYGDMMIHFQRSHRILGVKCGENFCDIRFCSCEHQRLYTSFCTRIWETNPELRRGRLCQARSETGNGEKVLHVDSCGVKPEGLCKRCKSFLPV